jgi:hypothetical protein
VLGHGYKTIIISIIPIELAIPVHNRIHRSGAPRGLAQLVQVRDDRLLVGYSHIDAAEIPAPQESLKFIRPQLTEFIRVGGQPPVNLAGETVPKMFADKTELHTT